MNGREIIKDIMQKRGVTNTILANRLGISQAALWDRVDTQPRNKKPRKDIPVSLLSEMIQAMDYKVIIVPAKTRLPKDGYLVDTHDDVSSIKQV